MNFALGYIVERAFFRFADFFHHWYIDASKVFIHVYFFQLEQMDQTFAVKTTLRHFFEPLYGDYSYIGRILGFVFRPLRVLLGGIFYFFWTMLWFLIYISWLALPMGLLLYVYYSFA